MLGYLKLLAQHPKFTVIQNAYDPSTLATSGADYEKERAAFLDKMLAHSKAQMELEAKNKKALQDAYSKFEKDLKGMNSDAEALLKGLSAEPEIPPAKP